MKCLVHERERLIAAGWLALLLCCGLLQGQSASGQVANSPDSGKVQHATSVLTGTVTDGTGAVLPGAQVQLTGVNGKLTVHTDHQGGFKARVQPGTYGVRIEVPDFAPYQSPSLQLRAGQTTQLPVQLEIAGLAQQVDADTASSPDERTVGGSLTFEGKALDLLSDDDETLLRQLRALAGGGLNGGGLQILVNGFSGGGLPPKSSIRSIRVNGNEYSAFYDSPGFGRIEVQTRPGASKLHGALNLGGTDQPFNARNPYTGAQPPYYQFLTDGNVNGPLGKKTSFFVSEQIQSLANNAVINAVNPFDTTATLSEALPAPQRTDVYSLRLDRQFSTNNFAFIRDAWSQAHITNSGINPLVLPSAAYALNTLTNTLQASDTQILSPHAVNEVRFQYLRTRIRQDPNSTAPALVAEGSFIAGGSETQVLRDNQDHYELQDEFDLEHGPHSFRAGLRLREQRDGNTSSANFNGQFIFPSLAAYQITQNGLAAGQSPAQIRAAGGGASQFNLTAGQPSAMLYTDDIAFFAEDDWKLRPDLTFSYGLRFESQSAVPDHVDPAPRVSLKWAPRRGNSPEPFITVGAGYGIFYDRFAASNLLQAIHQNGQNETAYFVQDPDFYPNLPPPAALPTSQPTVYQVNPSLRSSYQQVGGITVTRDIGQGGAVQGKYLFSHGSHGYLLRNSNAPLPGTYNPDAPESGMRPLGTAENIYQYASAGNSNSNNLSVAANLPVGKLFLYSQYAWERTYSENTYDPATGLTGFTAHPYNIAADYARSLEMQSQRFELGLIWTLPRGFSLRPYLDTHSGNPFDITTGSDDNGDTIYNDRPAFATDLGRASVVRTSLGNFDLNPQAGQTVIPRNFGTAPSFVFVDLTSRYTLHVGPRPAAKPGAKVRADRPYSLRFQVDAQNLFNHTNPGPPIGVLASPYFGRSLSLATDFNTFSASNRTILLQCLFSF